MNGPQSTAARAALALIVIFIAATAAGAYCAP